MLTGLENVSWERMIKLKIEAFDSGIKPLIRHQRRYFTGHETSLIKSLLNLRGSANGTPISHVADESLLTFIDLVDADLAANILLGYVAGYVESRERYDETQGTAGVVPATSSVVLTLKGLAGVVRRLSPTQVEMNLARIAPLGIIVRPPTTPNPANPDHFLFCPVFSYGFIFVRYLRLI
jgi:hypothetical protein